MPLPKRFADFTIVPLSYKGSELHVLYLREHVIKPRGDKKEAFPSGRTLFVVNIPADATERELSLFFKPYGIVERVVFDRGVWSPETYGPIEESEDEISEGAGGADEGQAIDPEANLDDSNHRSKKRKLSKNKSQFKVPPKVTPLPVPEPALRTFHHTGSYAHIIFLDPQSLIRVLSAGLTEKPPPWPPTTAAVAPSGLAHYTALHSSLRPPLPDVRAHADTYMEVYDFNMAISKRKSKYKKGEAVVDEEGFTLVTRGGAYGTTLGGGVGVASKRFMKNVGIGREVTSGKRGKKRPKIHEKDAFYKFQRHERKRKELEKLRVDWKKDQEAAAQLIESRQYKPY